MDTRVPFDMMVQYLLDPSVVFSQQMFLTGSYSRSKVYQEAKVRKVAEKRQ